MKKIISLGGLYVLTLIQSCICPNNGFNTTYLTIESVGGLFYSFDENETFPYLDDFNRAELGISVFPDSISERIEVSQLLRPIINYSYACEDPSQTENENLIDSVNIFTKYKFDSQHDAGSNINDILKPLDIFGKTMNGIFIDELYFFDQYFKFSMVPEADSMQFVITGRISGKGNFTTQTDLIVLLD